MKKGSNILFLLALTIIIGASFYVSHLESDVTGYYTYKDVDEAGTKRILSEAPTLPMLDNANLRQDSCANYGRLYVNPLCMGADNFKCASTSPSKEGFEFKNVGTADCDFNQYCFCGYDLSKEHRTAEWIKTLNQDGTITAAFIIKIINMPSDKMPVNAIITGRHQGDLSVSRDIKVINRNTGKKIHYALAKNTFHASVTDFWCTKEEMEKTGYCEFIVDVVFKDRKIYDKGMMLKGTTGSADVNLAGDICYTGTPLE
jgi:hypothetical protein